MRGRLPDDWHRAAIRTLARAPTSTPDCWLTSVLLPCLSTLRSVQDADPSFFVPFADFVRAHPPLEPVAYTFLPLWAACGYTYFETVPALYIMKFLQQVGLLLLHGYIHVCSRVQA